MAAVATVPPFESFYVEHRGVVLGFLRRRLGAQAAEDAFQETFLRARRYGGPPRGAPVTLAWLYTIANHCCFDLLRKHGRERPADPEATAGLSGPAGGDVERDLILRKMVGRIDARTREIGLLHHLGGLTQEEVASRLGTSRKTVGRKLALFEALLRGLWQGESDVR